MQLKVVTLQRLFQGAVIFSVFFTCAVDANENFSVGPTGLYSLISRHPAPARLSWGVLGTDFWHPTNDAQHFRAVTEFPVHRPFFQRTPVFLLQGDHFTPDVYLEQIQELGLRPGGCDVLFYYGGRARPGMESHGLNINSWSAEDLQNLRRIGGRPFIGLETIEPALIDSLLHQIEAGGYGHGDTLYIRIGAEPSGMPYGTVDGRGHGPRHVQQAFDAYKKRFIQAARQLRKWGRAHDVRFQIVFAGDSREDFEHYVPSADEFDAIGYDLYVTPANIRQVMPLLKFVAKRYADKPLVIPELGIATGGHPTQPRQWAIAATPQWGQAALGDVLMALGRHPAGVAQMTVFSVNVAARLESRRWNWAWTPRMFDMLAEWREMPRHWKKDGFHRYDPSSFPLGKDTFSLTSGQA